MRRPRCSLVGLGAGVKLGRAVGKDLSGMISLEILKGLEGINMHKTMARTTKTNPIGRRTLRGLFRRVKIRRLEIDIGLPIILHRIEAPHTRSARAGINQQ